MTCLIAGLATLWTTLILRRYLCESVLMFTIPSLRLRTVNSFYSLGGLAWTILGLHLTLLFYSYRRNCD